MKMKILKFIALMLILAISFSSCTKKVELGGDVPYKPCPCEEEKSSLESYQGEAYLFKDSIPEQMVYQIRTELSKTTDRVCWIVYDSKTNSSNLTVGYDRNLSSIGEICNFPDFVEEWNIPPNGCKVYFEGMSYESCTPKGGVAVINYFDFILTSLKRK